MDFGTFARPLYPHTPVARQRWPFGHVVVPHTQAPLVQVPGLPALQSALALHWQVPPAQTSPAGQARPHPPQFAAFVVRSKHPAGVWQQVRPAMHARPPLHAQPVPEQVSPCAHTALLQWH